MRVRLSGAEQWDATVALLADWADWWWDHLEPIGLGRAWALSRVVRPHRLFLVGDVVPIPWINGGGERQPITAVTGRGYVVRGLYMRYAAHTHADGNFIQHQFGHLAVVESPADLAGLPPDAPGIRRFVVETLRGGDPASPVAAPCRAFLDRFLERLARPPRRHVYGGGCKGCATCAKRRRGRKP